MFAFVSFPSHVLTVFAVQILVCYVVKHVHCASEVCYSDTALLLQEFFQTNYPSVISAKGTYVVPLMSEQQCCLVEPVSQLTQLLYLGWCIPVRYLNAQVMHVV